MQNRKMIKGYILLIIDSMGIGGAEKMTLTLAEGFTKEGYHVDLIICDSIIRLDISSKIRLHTLNFKKSFLNYVQYRRKLHKLIDNLKNENKNPFELILVNLQKSTRLMKGYSKENVFHIVHSTLSEASLKGREGIKLFFKRKKLQSIYNDLNIITVSDGILKDLRDEVKIRAKSIQTIYNPMNSEEILKLSEEENCINQEEYIVHVGRFAKVKRHDLLLEAFKKSKLQTKLFLVGDGEERFNIIEKIKDLRLEEQVILTGFLKNPYPLIKNAKMLVLCSDYEGLPTVLIEALILNTPIISSNCPSGPNEILVDDLNKFLVHPNSVDELAEMLQYLFGTEYKVKAMYYEKFLMENVLKQYLELM